jgi:hypothetical protein
VTDIGFRTVMINSFFEWESLGSFPLGTSSRVPPRKRTLETQRINQRISPLIYIFHFEGHALDPFQGDDHPEGTKTTVETGQSIPNRRLKSWVEPRPNDALPRFAFYNTTE